MGATAAAIGIGTVVAGLAGSYISSRAAAENNERTIDYNKWSQAETERYNTMMYEKQLSDNQSLYEKYQSPTAIAAQLRAAGVNPASVLGSGSGIGSSPSAPSLASVSPTSLSGLQNEGQPYADALGNITRAMQSIASSDLQQSQKNEIDKTLQERIRGIIAQNNGQELANSYQEISNSVFKAFGHKKAAAEVSQLVNSAFLNYTSGRYQEALTEYQSVMKKIGEADLDYKNKSTPILLDNLRKSVQLCSEQITTEKAKQNELIASAENTRSKTSFQNMENDIKSIEHASSMKMKEELIYQLSNKLLNESVSDNIKSEIELRRKRIQNASTSHEKLVVIDSFLDYIKDKLSIFKLK